MLHEFQGTISKKTIPISILIVDGDGLLIDSFKKPMESAGFNVETASSGEEALAKSSLTKFKLAVVDLNLPDMSVSELSRMLKENILGISVMLLPRNCTTLIDIQSNNEKGFLELIDPDVLSKVIHSTKDWK